MKVLERYTENLDTWTENTLHISHRDSRLQHYDDSRINAAFLVDKNHPNGLEVHAVCDNGNILIFNEESHKLITVLYARPNQVSRYYESLKMKTPEHILENARINQRTGRNSL